MAGAPLPWGLRRLGARHAALQPTRVVLATTGGYERTVVAALVAVTRKLLLQLNAGAGRPPWTEEPTPAA